MLKSHLGAAIIRTGAGEWHRAQGLEIGGSVITERLYIDVKQDVKKKKKKKKTKDTI